uniref:Solute carrier family 15 member 1 n=1 Tax=Myotis myotis TaxID=51298 RepID=A0A7J7Z8D6_MYOMY|nr:solute carrier family 15 member 1 [Myotis myotis]
MAADSGCGQHHRAHRGRSRPDQGTVGRVHSVCFVASGCLHHLCHHGSIVHLHQSSGN